MDKVRLRLVFCYLLWLILVVTGQRCHLVNSVLNKFMLVLRWFSLVSSIRKWWLCILYSLSHICRCTSFTLFLFTKFSSFCTKCVKNFSFYMFAIWNKFWKIFKTNFILILIFREIGYKFQSVKRLIILYFFMFL